MIPVNKNTVPFWRYHVAPVFPAKIICEIDHRDIGIAQSLFVVIDHGFKLVPEVTVPKRLDIFLNYAIQVKHMCGVQLNIVDVDLVSEHFDSLVANFF